MCTVFVTGIPGIECTKHLGRYYTEEYPCSLCKMEKDINEMMDEFKKSLEKAMEEAKTND